MLIKKALKEPLLILFTGFVGGYTVSNFPKEFLDLFSHPIGQFVSYAGILSIYYINDTTVTNMDIIQEAFIYVVIIQSLRYLLNVFYT